MGQDVSWLVLTIVLAIVSMMLGAYFLGSWNRERRRDRRRAMTFLVVGVALVLAASVVFASLYVIRIESETVRFSYTVTLTSDAPGTVRVSLPVPADESLLASLELSPGATAAMNRTGGEPALDVTLAGTTTVRVSATLYRYAGPYDMTRMDSQESCMYVQRRCNATVSMHVLSGSIGQVRVVAHADWSGSCGYTDWSLDAIVFPGEWEYPATYLMAVC